MTTTAYLSTAEVARRFRVSVATVNRWASAGLIKPAARAPGARGAYLYDPEYVSQLLAEAAS